MRIRLQSLILRVPHPKYLRMATFGRWWACKKPLPAGPFQIVRIEYARISINLFMNFLSPPLLETQGCDHIPYSRSQETLFMIHRNISLYNRTTGTSNTPICPINYLRISRDPIVLRSLIANNFFFWTTFFKRFHISSYYQELHHPHSAVLQVTNICLCTLKYI